MSMRWYTCSPRNFPGGQDFFDRESGLLSRGFQAIGVESMAVTLGPAKEGDLPQMIRATAEELASADWWRGHHLDGVVFYCWGDPEFRPIADAIVAAGIRLVSVSDTHGVCSPLADWRGHLISAWHHQWQHSFASKLARTVLRIPYFYTLGILRNDLPRARMIASGDFFLAATPDSAERHRRLVRRLLGGQAAAKVRFLPVPVNFHFGFDAADRKSDEVVAVGRWDSPQKRPRLLMEVFERAAARRPATRFRIFGRIPEEMTAWHAGLPEELRGRIVLEGQQPNSAVSAAYRRARVMFVSAAFEGCHNASAEAICSGCSIVGVDTPFLCALKWHASHESGMLSRSAAPADLTDALCAELETWDRGDRDPRKISASWCSDLHPDHVAREILELYGLEAPVPENPPLESVPH
jgi:glycosyltransferase involved in cell wall biosynthesis